MVYTVSKELREFVENGMKHNPFAVLSRLVYDGIYREIIDGRLRVSDNIVVSQLAGGPESVQNTGENRHGGPAGAEYAGTA